MASGSAPATHKSVEGKKKNQEIAGGRYWDRTSDLFRVSSLEDSVHLSFAQLKCYERSTSVCAYPLFCLTIVKQNRG
jgi:hypothetical protein